jgi:outer membrane protein assembly factor BamB
MVRVRIGEGWRSDPRLQEALRREAPIRARESAVRDIVDVLAIEVDGVDIGAGRTEAPVVESAAGLLAAVSQLASGASEAAVPFPDGAVELLLRRRGGSALLSIVSLARPARVLAHEVEVDLEALSDAAREAAGAWCRRVAEVEPRAAAVPAVRRLLRAAARRSRIRSPPLPEPAPAPRVLRARRPRGRPACSFEIHDQEGRLLGWRGRGADLASLLVPGRVVLRGSDGREILAVAGAPFLLLRDLCSAAARVAGAGERGAITFLLASQGRHRTLELVLDVATGSLSVDGRYAAEERPLALARAFFEAAGDFCAVVQARNPAQIRNARLAGLREAAAEGLAHVREMEAGDRVAPGARRLRVARPTRPAATPLGPGRLRLVSFRRVVEADVGPPAGDGILHLAGPGPGGTLLACGQRSTLALDAATAVERWRGEGGLLVASSEGSVVTTSADALACRDLAAGGLRWRRSLPSAGSGARRLLGAAGAQVVVLSGGTAWALDTATGSPRWAFDSPGAMRLDAARFGSVLVVAADTGLVHGLDPAGGVSWRLRGSGPLAAPPVQGAGACLLLFLAPLGASLVAVDAGTGRRRFAASLDLTPTSAPVSFAGRVAVAGTVGGDPVVAVLESDGTPAWTGTVLGGPGPAALAPAPGALLAKSADGSCALLGRDGAPLWSRPGAGPPSLGNPPPVAWRGLVLVPGEETAVLDLRRGHVVGRLPAQAPARLLATGDEMAWALDGEGLLTGARLRSHLAVVEGSRGSAPAGAT